MPALGYSDITAADAVGSPPFVSIECPDDGTKPKGDDFKVIAATALANDDYRATQITGLGSTKYDKAGGVISGDVTVGSSGAHKNLEVWGTSTLHDDVTLGGKIASDVTTTGHVKAEAARTYVRACIPWNTPTAWNPVTGLEAAFPAIAQQTSSVTPGSVADDVPYRVPAPDTATITAVTITLFGLAGHGAMPATKPKITLYKINVATGAKTTVGTATDPSSTTGVYEVLHSFSISGLSETVDATDYLYVVRVEGESGLNATNGLEIHAPRVTYTRARIGED